MPKDYTGTDNNPETFLSVLSGKDMNGIGSGKSLKSGKNDHVFVYFADHGAPGILGFGMKYLKADDLNQTLNDMHRYGLFSKLVFYVEACESGSMFENILSPMIEVYATTASNSTASSFACYYDPEVKTFLGDVYSVKWLEGIFF